MEKLYCVYKHTTPTGKVYVGITKRDVKKRWMNGRGYLYNHHFANAINKYGWGNIKHEILAEKLSETDAKNMERFFIQMYKANDPKYGYNKTPGGDDASHFEKCVLQYDLNGKLIRRYDSLTEAAETTNTQISRISDCTKGNRFSTHGFIWILEEDEQKEEKLKKAIKEKRHPSAMCGGANHRARAVEQYTLDGVFIKTYSSAQEASDELNIDYSTIKTCASNCASNRAKSAGGYIWIHSDEADKQKALTIRINKGCEKPVSQYSLDGVYIRDFASVTEAMSFINAKANHISDVCNGKRNKSHGFIWKWKTA